VGCGTRAQVHGISDDAGAPKQLRTILPFSTYGRPADAWQRCEPVTSVTNVTVRNDGFSSGHAEVRFDANNHVVECDADGNRHVDLRIAVNVASMQASDFIL
jgi:hypothetical protein